jgi:cytochrome bd-type quinol oxidase subunit 2
VDFDPSRLRRGELIVGASAIVLLASMFALKWYGLSIVTGPAATKLGVATSRDGWTALSNVRWLVLLTVLCSLALVFLQATRRAPALPVTMSVIVLVLAILTALALLYRVVINEPGADNLVEQKAGAFVGLISAIALVYGGYQSLRQEGIAPRDAPVEIETIRPSSAGGS